MFVGDFFVWLYDSVIEPLAGWAGGMLTDGSGLGVFLSLAFLLLSWRISLAVFPDKRCRRCKGNGSWGPGKLRRECGRCNAGRVRRFGA